jgi:hypothetical protein
MVERWIPVILLVLHGFHSAAFVPAAGVVGRPFSAGGSCLHSVDVSFSKGANVWCLVLLSQAEPRLYLCAHPAPCASAPALPAQQKFRLSCMTAVGGSDGDTDDAEHLNSSVHLSTSQQKKGAGELHWVVISRAAKSVAIAACTKGGGRCLSESTHNTHRLLVDMHSPARRACLFSVFALLCWTCGLPSIAVIGQAGVGTAAHGADAGAGGGDVMKDDGKGGNGNGAQGQRTMAL